MIDNENKKWCVYMHTVPKELSGYDWDKHYIGITGRGVEARWANDGEDYKKSVYFYNAIKKYGWGNIKHDVLENNITAVEACEKEQYYIQLYQSNIRKYGYNICPGGYNGGGNAKNIAMYDLDGNFIKVFPSISEAMRYIGITTKGGPTCVNRAAKKCGTAFGYQWRYANTGYEKNIDPYYDPRTYQIEQYTLSGEYIRTWNSVKEINKTLNIHLQTQYYTKEDTIYIGYQWKKKGSNKTIHDLTDSSITIQKISYPPKKTPRVRLSRAKPKEELSYGSYGPIFMYDKEGNFIKEFKNTFQLRQEMSFTKSQLPYFVFKLPINKNYYNGYRWTNTYYDHLPPLTKKSRYLFPIAKIDITTNIVIDIYTNAKEAQEINGFSDSSSISKVAKGNDKKYETAFGYKWKRIQDIQESDIQDSFLIDKYYSLLGKLKRKEGINGQQYNT